MNNQTPTESPESPLTQKNQGRARVKLAIFFVLAIHFVGLMGLLMLGCQKEKEPVPQISEQTNQPPAFEPYTNTTALDTNVPQATIDTNPPPVITQVDTNPPPAQLPLTGATEYTIVKGDTFSSIAKKQGVTVRALTEANPNVNSSKLKIGQKIQIPASTKSAGATEVPKANGTAAPAAGTANGDGTTYTVKSGDTLTKIASHYGVTVKAIKDANGLKTEKIKVSQKLKIPAKKGGSTTPAPTGTGTTATNA